MSFFKIGNIKSSLVSENKRISISIDLHCGAHDAKLNLCKQSTPYYSFFVSLGKRDAPEAEKERVAGFYLFLIELRTINYETGIIIKCGKERPQLL